MKQRKLASLCRQVQQTLHLTLPADLGLEVASVSPATDPGRLILILVATDLEEDSLAVSDRVQALAGPLRAEVAGAIHRRKAPELVFRISRGSDLSPFTSGTL